MIPFLGTILLLGCIQGVIAFVLLSWSKHNRPANRLLGMLILLISLATFKVYSNAQGWWGQGLVLILISNFVPFFLIMPLGPLIFFYTKSCLDPGFVVGKRNRRHFYPVLLDLVPVLAAFLYLGLIAFGRAQPGDGRWANFIDSYNDYVDIPRWISITIYLLASRRLLKNAGEGEIVQWLRQFIMGFMIFQAIWLLFLVPYEIRPVGDWMLDHLGWYPLYVPLVILSYWLGIKGYLLSQVSRKSVASAAASASAGAVVPEAVVENAVRALTRLMAEEKLYRDCELNLPLLAKRVGVPPKTLSAILNQHLGKSFSEYLNGYRVVEVQGRLLGGDSSKLTIAGLAYESGFNSLQTFQRAFKSISGVTPSEFMLKSGIE